MTTTQTPVLTELTSVRARHAAGTPKPPPLPSDAGAAGPDGVDLTALSDDALAALVEQGQVEITQRHQKKTEAFLAMVAATAKTLGVSSARLTAALSNKSHRSHPLAENDGRRAVRPKFWCVADHSLRWSGRGGAPKWFSDHITSGGKEEDMRIPEGQQ